VVTEATGSVRRRWCSPSGRGPARPRRYATTLDPFRGYLTALADQWEQS